MNRRQFLQGLGVATVVVGFEPVSRSWVTAAAAAASSSPFDQAPPLDGQLLTDAGSRNADATDRGNLVFRTPAAVLRPGSVSDISAMIRFCGQHGIQVSARGHAHSTYGQGLCAGLVIEAMALNQIHSIGPYAALVDTGASWRQLVTASFNEAKLTPPALTGYVGLSIGGTLSMGGIGGLVGGLHTGLQVDHVRQLEVVTGTGEVVTCDESAHSDLFEVMLGGLGQCGVMTKATIDLIPAKDRARTYAYYYIDNAKFFADFRKALTLPAVDHIYNLWFPPGTTTFVYELQVTVFYDETHPPDDARFLTALSVPPAIEDFDYLTYVEQVDTIIDTFRTTASWDSLVKPWFDVWLPDSTVEKYVGLVAPELTSEDVGPTGFVLIFAQRRANLTRPFVRVPPPDGSEWVFLFDILTASSQPSPGAAYNQRMISRNDRLFSLARHSYGGVRYPIGTVDFTTDDWQNHYGDLWQTFVERKHKFDPLAILTPGPGIF